MGRLKEGSPKEPQTGLPNTLCSSHALPKLLGAGSSRRAERAGGCSSKPTWHKPWHLGGRFGHQAQHHLTQAWRGDTTVLSLCSLEQGCLELVLVPKLSGVTTPRAAPNLAHTNTFPRQCSCHLHSQKGPLQARMLHGHFDGYFCIPSPAGAVIMLERADMLLPAMPISQWPSPCSIPAQTESSRAGSHGCIRRDSGSTGVRN